MTRPRALETLNPLTVRSDFPILDQELYGRWPLIYFDNAASTVRPLAVLDAMDRMERTSFANVHRGNHWLSEHASFEFEQARETMRALINASDPAEVIFTGGTTASINLVAHAWGNSRLKPGDEILLTIADHHSNVVPWQQLAARTGAKIVWYDHDIESGINIGEWSRLFSERTRLVAFPAVSNVLGFRAPVTEMTALARQANAISLVDAAQHAPHEPLDVQKWNADFTVFSGHKMLGPTGIGILHGRLDLFESMQPFLGGGSMIDTVSTGGFTPGRLPARFEAGTPPIVQAIGLAAAAKYLVEIGLDNIHSHEQRLTQIACELLSAIDGLRILGPTHEHRAGIVSFTVDGVNSQDLGKMLDLKGVATRAGHHCTMPLHEHLAIRSSLRASFYLYNTVDEVNLFAEYLVGAITRLRQK